MVEKQKTGRPPSCLCGECKKCRHRVSARERYQAMSMDERRALIARRDQDRVKANDRARYYRNRDERLARMKEWAANNRDVVREAHARWEENNPEKKAATTAVNNALRDGRLTKQPYENCGAADRVEGHHDDYTKPLEVRWLCRRCHAAYHAMLRGLDGTPYGGRNV